MKRAHLDRPQMEEFIMRICAPVEPLLFRRFLQTLSDAQLIKEYLAVMHDVELEQAA